MTLKSGIYDIKKSQQDSLLQEISVPYMIL